MKRTKPKFIVKMGKRERKILATCLPQLLQLCHHKDITSILRQEGYYIDWKKVARAVGVA